MILIGLIAFRPAQAPDTVGLRQALGNAIAAVWRREIPKAAFAKAPHIFVDQQSFKRIAGVDTAASVDWSSLAGALGKQGTVDSTATCGGSECPWVDGTLDTRSRAQDTLTFSVEFHHPEMVNGRRVVGWSPWRVRLVRRNRSWVVTNVSWISD
jgi:hypothetical protein